MADDNLMDQDEIEQLLTQAIGGGARPASSDASSSEAPVGAAARPGSAALASPAAAPGRPAAQSAEEDPSRLLGQDDIEKLLSQAGKAAPPPVSPQAAANAPTAMLYPGEGTVQQGDVDFLLSQAEQALASIQSPHEKMPQGVAAFRLEELNGAPASTESATLDLIRDVELDLRIELGRTNMYIEDVLKLRRGSVVPLDRLAGDPVDIFVNGRLIARGEVLVLNDNFCVRVAELIAGSNVFGG